MSPLTGVVEPSVVTVARPGTYTATVYSGLVTSNTVVFVLRGPVGVAQP